MKRLFVSLLGIFVLILHVQASNHVVKLDVHKSTQKQMDKSFGGKPNSIFIITEDFDLKNQLINLPESCVIRFEGGTLNNGVLIGCNTRIEAPLIKIFNKVSLEGTWVIDGLRIEWFGAAPNNPNVDCSNALNISIANGGKINVPVLLSSANYYIRKTIRLDAVGMQGINSQQSIISFDPSLDVGIYITGQFRSFKNIRVQNTEPNKNTGVCVKVGDLNSKTSSTRGYIENIVVTGGEVGLDLQYQWCNKISGVIAKNNFIGIRASKTNACIDNAIVEDNICGVLSSENGVKLLSCIIEGNSIGCYLNGKENALTHCYFEGNDLKRRRVTTDKLKEYGISTTTGGHLFVGIDRPVTNMIISGCHIHGSQEMVVDRCQSLVVYGNSDISKLSTTKHCKVKIRD